MRALSLIGFYGYKYFLWALLVLFSSHVIGGEVQYTGTFSSIRYHHESGDISGVELRVVYTKKGYAGTLQICEGGAGELILVKPIIEKGNIKFIIDDAQYAGDFSGVVESDGIHGKFTFSGNVGVMEVIPRKKSYWD